MPRGSFASFSGWVLASPRDRLQGSALERPETYLARLSWHFESKNRENQFLAGIVAVPQHSPDTGFRFKVEPQFELGMRFHDLWNLFQHLGEIALSVEYKHGCLERPLQNCLRLTDNQGMGAARRRLRTL